MKTVQELIEAANNGDSEAQYNVGLLHALGRGTPRDPKTAAHWFSLAAENGHADAQCNLGFYLATGEGVAQDVAAAAARFMQAAAQDHAQAHANLGRFYAAGIGVEADMMKAAEAYARAADGGVAEAAYNLGLIYYNGAIHGSPNHEEAAKCFLQAAEANVAEAQYALGLCYSNGEGVELDDDKAVAWYQKAAAQDHPASIYNLGIYTQSGLGGLDENEAAARELFKRAAALGHEKASEAEASS